MFCVYFFFNDTATTEIYTYLHTLSLHDALPISTPWTIPVNQALAYCPTIDDEHFDASYTVYRVEDDGPLKGLRFLLSASLVQAFAQRAGVTQFVAESAITPSALSTAIARHPMHKLGGFFAKPDRTSVV